MFPLSEVAALYIEHRNKSRPIGRELSGKTGEHLFESVAAFSRHLTRPATVDDFSAATINAYLAAVVESGRSAYTAKSRRTGLCVLWRFAAECGLAKECRGVRAVYCPQLNVDGYDAEKMVALLAYVRSMRGVIRNTGIAKSVWWDSFLRTDWEAGLRIGDMLTIEREHFDTSGWLWARENKTGKAGWHRLSEPAVDAVITCIAASATRKFIWPGYCRRNICRAFSAIAKAAGVGGTSRYIRRGGSSECDRLYPGQGWRFLRHSNPAVWEKHYRVDKIVAQNAPGPPPL